MLFNGFLVPFAAAISPETIKLVWQTPLFGMLMIFAVLGLLWAVLSVFKLVFVGKAPKPVEKVKDEVKASATAVPAPTVAPAPVAQTADAELVAIITAAVAAYMAKEGISYDGGFRVVSFKKVRGGRTWNTK